MWNRTFFAAAVTGAILAAAQPAAAFGPGGFIRDYANTAVVSYTSSIKPIVPQRDAAVFKMALTTFREGQLKRINASYNRSLAPRPAGEIVSAKRDRLVSMGFPAAALHIEAVDKSDVLILRTHVGDLMLTDRTNDIADIDRITTAAIAN